MEIFEIPPEGRRDFMELLLLADESEAMISRYIGRGRMYVLTVWGEAAAECLVTDEGGGVLEIQSIAVAPEHRRHGYGRALIEFLAEEFAGEYAALTAGTGESPFTTPFYTACGFVYSHRVENFFIENYPRPIVEGGVTLRDKVYYRRELCCAERIK